MTLISEARHSDSPFIEQVMRGWTTAEGSSLRPAEIHWHMVFVWHSGDIHTLMVGPLTSSGVATWGEGAEILWVKFKLGAFMPHLPARIYLNSEQALPDAARQRFWLKGAAVEIPDFESAEDFIERLARQGDLVMDPAVSAALQDQAPEIPSRTLRHRFLRATGQTQSHIRQYERAIKAASLLRHGVSILDTAFEAGYFDQPHMTRSLKHFLGYTPSQIVPEGNA